MGGGWVPVPTAQDVDPQRMLALKGGVLRTPCLDLFQIQQKAVKWVKKCTGSREHALLRDSAGKEGLEVGMTCLTGLGLLVA